MRWTDRCPPLAAFVLVVAVLSGCAGPGGTPPPDGTSTTRAEPATPPPPAEPGNAPPSHGPPPGQILPLPGGAPEGTVFDPVTGTLAVALRNPGRLAFIKTASADVRTVPAPGAARHLALGRPGELLVPAEDTNVLTRVALPGGAVLQRTKVGDQPHEAARFGETLFVSNEFGGSVGIVRGGRMVRQLEGLVQPGGLTVSGDRVAVVDVRGNTLHVIDATTPRDVGVLAAGEGPSHVHPIGSGRVAVADTRGNAVVTYQVTGRPRQLSRVPAAGRAYGLASDSAREVLYATLPDTNQVTRWRVAADGSLRDPRTVPTVRQPNDVAVDPNTGAVYVVGQNEARVQRIPAAMFGPR